MKAHHWIASLVLVITVIAGGIGLASWKRNALRESAEAAMQQPEPMESVIVETAREIEHRATTTAIGTVLALRSVTLRNEVPGTVAQVELTPGGIVEAGKVLVALDVSVEEAELKALEAQTALAETTLTRMQRLISTQAAPQVDLDRAKAERDVAVAQTARTKAVMARKTIRAPFRARIGLSNLHPGQYLAEGTELASLQGVDGAVHVDFTVTQYVAAGLHEGDAVEVIAVNGEEPVIARIVAIDARVDPQTRNATVRAKIDDASKAPAPGASVRVRVPVGMPRKTIAIPVSALRRGPEGDHAFVIVPDKNGKSRASLRLVRSGLVEGDQVLIETGLKAGEQVASSGSFKLREGVLVATAAKAGDVKQAH